MLTYEGLNCVKYSVINLQGRVKNYRDVSKCLGIYKALKHYGLLRCCKLGKEVGW